MDREFKLAIRVIGFAVAFLVLAWLLFRVAVPFAWGLHSDLGPPAAFAVGGLGGLALLYLLYLMIRNVRGALRRAEGGKTNGSTPSRG